MGLVTSVDTVWFHASDMERATAFYASVLGLKVQYASPYWTAIACGEVTIGLHHSDGSQSSGGWVVSVLCDDLRALRAALAAAGARVSDEYHDTPRGAILDFWDPDGNHLQAMQLGAKAADLS